MTVIFDEHRKEYERLLQECKQMGHKPGRNCDWVYYQMKEKYGEEIAKKVCEYDDVYEEW